MPLETSSEISNSLLRCQMFTAYSSPNLNLKEQKFTIFMTSITQQDLLKTKLFSHNACHWHCVMPNTAVCWRKFVKSWFCSAVWEKCVINSTAILQASWQCYLYLCFPKRNAILNAPYIVLFFFLPLGLGGKAINFVLESLFYTCSGKKKKKKMALMVYQKGHRALFENDVKALMALCHYLTKFHNTQHAGD